MACSHRVSVILPIVASGPGLPPRESAVEMRAAMCSTPATAAWYDAMRSRNAGSSRRGRPPTEGIRAASRNRGPSRLRLTAASPVNASRSFDKVVMATVHPAPTAPTRM